MIAEEFKTFGYIRNDLFKIPPPPETPYLVGAKCKVCSRVFFPRLAVCSKCKTEGTIEITPLSRRGKLYAGAVCQRAPFGFKAPYIVGYVDLPERVRLFTQLIGDGLSDENLTPGRDVELVIEKIREDDSGNDVIGYKFRVL